MTPNYKSVSEYAELCSAAKAAAWRSLSRISTSVSLTYLPGLPVTRKLTQASRVAVFCSTKLPYIPSAYPDRHSGVRRLMH